MTRLSIETSYDKRLNRVIDYIHDNLDDELDLNKLAEVAHMSPYHWHRVYSALYGETIATTVKRLRMHRAAGYIANSSMSIEEIARKSGYKSQQSFNRVFKSVFGLPPALYRKRGSHTRFQSQINAGGSAMYPVEIKTLPNMQVANVKHTGAYMGIAKAFDKLFGTLASQNIMDPGLRIIGIFYDDPDSVDEDKLRSRAGVILDNGIAIPSGLEQTEIPGGEYAVLRHQGPYADMKAAYEWLYGDWLVQSGREPADEPCFEEYLNNPMEVAPTELLSDIYLPLMS